MKSEVRFSSGTRDLFLLQNARNGCWGPSNPCWVGIRGSFQGVTRQGLEADYSYPSSCCLVISTCTVLLFYRTHFYWCVSPYVYCCSCNSRSYFAGHGNGSKTSVHTLARCDRRAAWSAGLGHSRRLAFAGPVSWWWIILYFFWNLALHYADTLNHAVSGTRGPNINWRVQRQQWYLITLLFLV
jgi:hypothetical protein